MKLRITLMALMAILTAAVASAAQKPSKLYLYGFSASFNDSTVYFTQVQELDTAWVDAKTGFLYSRDNYSYQLRDYLKGQGVARPTCITSYAKNRKDAEKKYTKLRKKYTQGNNFNVRYITPNDFSYTTIRPDDSDIYTGKKLTKEEKKAEKAKRKAEEKAMKAQTKGKKPAAPGSMPPPPGGMGGQTGGQRPPMH